MRELGLKDLESFLGIEIKDRFQLALVNVDNIEIYNSKVDPNDIYFIYKKRFSGIDLFDKFIQWMFSNRTYFNQFPVETRSISDIEDRLLVRRSHVLVKIFSVYNYVDPYEVLMTSEETYGKCIKDLIEL